VDTISVAETMERDITRLKAARPNLVSRIERAEHILVTQLATANGSRPVKVRVHADGSRSYAVRSGSKLCRSYRVSPESWSCDCHDHMRRRAACKHALACWVLARAFGERAYRPSPVLSTGRGECSGLERLEAPHGTPHGCMDGLVFIGHMIEEDGEEVEVVEAVPCRRCADRA